MNSADISVLEPKRMSGFVETGFVKEIVERAMAYIEAGFPVHLRGTSGTGKTTIAMHLAGLIGRPVVMIHGDEEHSTSDLVGGEYGYRKRRVVDNFIHSVLKTEESMAKTWVDNRLTVACKYGFTLVYDEFTRSRPEANNVLLSVLQERIMDLPASRDGYGYLKVSPDFTAIFTSNPEEYAGVYRSQDALRDRMVTIDLDYPDMETEVAVTAARSGLVKEEAEKIVKVVRELRNSGRCEFSPTVRGCIMIAKTLRLRGGAVSPTDRVFRDICKDVLASETSRAGSRTNIRKMRKFIDELIDKHCWMEKGKKCRTTEEITEKVSFLKG